MPVLLASTFIICLLISFAVGTILAYPIPSLIVVSMVAIAVAAYDHFNMGRRPY